MSRRLPLAPPDVPARRLCRAALAVAAGASRAQPAAPATARIKIDVDRTSAA